MKNKSYLIDVILFTRISKLLFISIMVKFNRKEMYPIKVTYPCKASFHHQKEFFFFFLQGFCFGMLVHSEL